MEFEYTSSIYIIKEDLEEMANCVKRGEDFNSVFFRIMAGYDDYDYYYCSLIKDKVREEIERRMK